MVRWRLYQEHFNGPGRYSVSHAGKTVSIEIDANGIFECDDNILLYAFAAVAGGKRDMPGADRRDVVTLMKEQIKRFEGQPDLKGRA